MHPVLKSLAGALALVSVSVHAGMVETPVDYRHGGETYRGYLIHDDAVQAPRPLLLLVPNWLGTTPENRQQAAEIAGQDYVVFVADMFGVGRQPADTDAAGKAVGALYADRKELRSRAAAALKQAEKSVRKAKLAVQGAQPAVIGFCFGGATALEMARAGTPLAATVSFHGNLSLSAEAPTNKPFKTRILALHGDADPFVPVEQVDAFVREMRASTVDWQLVSYGGAVHSFTDPNANWPGKAEYHPVIARRAFAQMRDFLAESVPAAR